MQNPQLLSLIKETGLSQKEAALYLAGILLGEASMQDLARQADIKRPTAYQIIQELIEKGIFSQIQRRKKRFFLAENPTNILAILKAKENAFQKALPELSLLYSTGGKKPRVKFYEGLEGIKNMYYDTLESKETLLEYGSIDDMWSVMPKQFIADYVKARIKKGLWVKGLIPGTPAGQDYVQKDRRELRELILVPSKKFMFSYEITIYDDRLAIISFPEKIGVIIESKKIAETQKMIFQLAWLGALQAV